MSDYENDPGSDEDEEPSEYEDTIDDVLTGALPDDEE